MAESKTRFLKNPSVIARRIGEQIVLVPTKGKAENLDNVYTVTGSGMRVWELIDGKRTVADINNAILKEFAVKPQQAQPDILAFLSKLEERKFITAGAKK